MIKKIIKNPLFWIFVLAFVLRIYKLGIFPFGVHVDEIKVGWNAYSILKTGFDDHGNKLSLYYNSIGDYRPTGIFYTAIPSIIAFGKTVFAIRFPSALIGALTIFAIYSLAQVIFKNKKLSLLAAFLLSINPWHIEVTRATSEVGISAFFAIYSIYFLIKLIEDKDKRYAFLSLIFITISYLFYHAIRFLAPPFFLVAILFYFKNTKSQQIKKYLTICFALVLSLSLFFSTTKEGRQRFNQVSIFNDLESIYRTERLKEENYTNTKFFKSFDYKYLSYFNRFITEYGNYLSTGFLIGDTAKPYRYTTPGAGLLTYVELILFGFGIVEISKSKKTFLPLILLLIAPIPAAITAEDVPNLHRAFLMLPFIILIEAYAFNHLLEIKKHKKVIKTALFTLLIANFIYFMHMYYNHSYYHKPFIKDYVLDGSSHRNVGTTELAKQLDDLSSKYDRVVVSSAHDNVYPWYAYFTNQNPKEFNQYVINNNNGSITYKNIIFSNIRCVSDDEFKKYNGEKVLFIESGDCAYESKIKNKDIFAKIIGTINRKSGTVVYVLLERTD